MHMLNAQPTAQAEAAQDYANSVETAQKHNPNLETAPYSTPYFISKELPQVNCNTLQTYKSLD